MSAADADTEAKAAPAAPTNLLAPGAPPLALEWFNPPPRAEPLPGGAMRFTTAPKTDFWQRTHYGFSVHSGHHYFVSLKGDFVLATTVLYAPNAQYDQAGLMVRISASCWLKASVEFQPGEGRPSQLGAVVTNSGWSDWSTCDLAVGSGGGDAGDGAAGGGEGAQQPVIEVSLRVRREGSDYLVEASLPGGSGSGSVSGSGSGPVARGGAPAGADGWSQIRMARLIEDAGPSAGVAAGLYACSPLGGGFEAVFGHLTLFAGRLGGGGGSGGSGEGGEQQQGGAPPA